MYLNIIYINDGIKGQDSYILQLKRQIILFIEIIRDLFFLPILGEKRIDRITNSLFVSYKNRNCLSYSNSNDVW